jgi:hypothetical protein
MGGVREERFERVVYHQGVSIIYERVEASYSYAVGGQNWTQKYHYGLEYIFIRDWGWASANTSPW